MCKHFITLAPLPLWHFCAALGLAWAGAPRSDVRHDLLRRARRVHLLVVRRTRGPRPRVRRLGRGQCADIGLCIHSEFVEIDAVEVWTPWTWTVH